MNSKFTYERYSMILGIGILGLFLISCKKFVEPQPPTTQIVTATVFNNSASATAAQLSIYLQMYNNAESWNISQNSGMLADELTSHSTSTTEIQLYSNSLIPTNDAGHWAIYYNYIYQANAIIASLQNNAAIAPTIKQQLIGESKFIRAFWHFYLTNIYGDIPLVLSTDYTLNESITRTPQAQVYSQIIKDLSDASHLLNSNYVDGTDTAVTSDRVRPTQSAAYAMLARTYLYMDKYDSAAAEASLVINNANYTLCANLSPLMGPASVFLKNSTEAIWQLGIPQPSPINTMDALDFILNGAPGTGAARSTYISPQLLNAFEPGDLRRTNWLGKYTTYYFPFKYQNTSSTITEYQMVLRLAEQYLIRAEAEAYLGDSAAAITDLNKIRNRANLPNYSDSANGSLLATILHERQVELFSEWGHRWFDLIRTGSIDAVMGGPSGVCQAKGGSWVSGDKLYPIPQTDINLDPSLSQNSGYN